MKQEKNNDNEVSPEEVQANFINKWGYLATAISSLIVSSFVIGLGVIWFFQMVQINNTYAVIFASQLSLLIFALSLFQFNMKDVLDKFKVKVAPLDLVKAFFTAAALVAMSAALLSMSPEKAGSTTNSTLLALIIGPIILAPIIEELGFRVGLKHVLIDKGKWSSFHYVVISSIMFSFIHWSPGSFNILTMLGTGVVGIVLSVTYLRTKNIYIIILIHLIYNAMIVLMSTLV